MYRLKEQLEGLIVVYKEQLNETEHEIIEMSDNLKDKESLRRYAILNNYRCHVEGAINACGIMLNAIKERINMDVTEYFSKN